MTMSCQNNEKLKILVIRTYIHMFHIRYSDYFESENSKDLVTFFFDKIYSNDAMQELHIKAFNVYEKLQKIIPEGIHQRIQPLLELVNLTDILDLQIVQGILQEKIDYTSHEVIPQDDFIKLMKKYNNQQEKQRQFELTLQNLASFFSLSKYKGVEMSLKSGYWISKTLKIGSLFKVLLEGYHATQKISVTDFNNFLNTVKQRETDFFNVVYK